MSTTAYWPLFCEENVWHLAGDLAGDVDEAWVVFISNPLRQVAVWAQKTARDETKPVVWDYHVVLLERAGARFRIIDPDSRLGMPADASRYLAASFPSIVDGLDQLRPLFRIIPADQYRTRLRSDRSHMRDTSGEWLSPPPPGPPIGYDANSTEREGSNLMRFIDMEERFIGHVCDLAGLNARIGAG